MKKHLTQSPLKEIYRSKKETKFFHKTLKCIVNPGRIISTFSWCLLAIRRLSFSFISECEQQDKAILQSLQLGRLGMGAVSPPSGIFKPFQYFSYLNSWNKPKVNLECQFSWLQEDFWSKIKTKYINQGIVQDPLKSMNHSHKIFLFLEWLHRFVKQ